MNITKPGIQDASRGVCDNLQKFNMQQGAALRWRRFTSCKKESRRILMGCFNREMEPQITYQIEKVVAHSCEYKSQILQDTLGVRQMEMCY